MVGTIFVCRRSERERVCSNTAPTLVEFNTKVSDSYAIGCRVYFVVIHRFAEIKDFVSNSIWKARLDKRIPEVCGFFRLPEMKWLVRSYTGSSFWWIHPLKQSVRMNRDMCLFPPTVRYWANEDNGVGNGISKETAHVFYLISKYHETRHLSEVPGESTLWKS